MNHKKNCSTCFVSHSLMCNKYCDQIYYPFLKFL